MARVRWWPHRHETSERGIPTDPAWRRPVLGLLLRIGAAALVLLPSAAVLVRLGEPFAMTAMASTSAIVLHSPARYRRRPGVIAGCYVAGLAITVPITLAVALTDTPGLFASTLAAVIIVASPLGRIHPPTACIPLAITASAAPVALLKQWAAFGGVAAGVLVALWILTVGARG